MLDDTMDHSLSYIHHLKDILFWQKCYYFSISQIDRLGILKLIKFFTHESIQDQKEKINKN